MISQVCSLDQVVLTSKSLNECVCERKANGRRIKVCNGQCWQETHPGFYQPVHLLARMPLDQVLRPSLCCWGFRTTLAQADAALANASMPLNMLPDVAGYDEAVLNSSVRNRLRKCRQSVEIVALTGPALLLAEGYDVLRSAHIRTRYLSIPSKQDYKANISQVFVKKIVTLAGIVKGKLGGYLQGYAIGPTLYFDAIAIATEYLPTHMGTGLVFEFVQVARRSGGIKEVVYGQHSPENESLVIYKERMGFPLVQVPSLVRMSPVMKMLLRKYKPHVYYRLTGNRVI